jgi:hypothetical protein
LAIWVEAILMLFVKGAYFEELFEVELSQVKCGEVFD